MPEEEIKYPENTKNKNRSSDVLPGKFVFATEFLARKAPWRLFHFLNNLEEMKSNNDSH